MTGCAGTAEVGAIFPQIPLQVPCIEVLGDLEKIHNVDAGGVEKKSAFTEYFGAPVDS